MSIKFPFKLYSHANNQACAALPETGNDSPVF